MRMDDRAIVNNLIIFAGMLVFAAVLYIGLEPIGTDLIDVQASVTDSQAAAQGQQYQRWTWEALPFIVIVIGMLQLIVAATAEGRL